MRFGALVLHKSENDTFATDRSSKGPLLEVFYRDGESYEDPDLLDVYSPLRYLLGYIYFAFCFGM